MNYIYQPSPAPHSPTFVLLHGTGGDENDLLPLAAYFGKEINVLSLRGNVLEHGMPRFFRRLGMGVFDEKDLEFRTLEMVDAIRDLSVSEKFDLDKLVALGYSNGANIAGATLVKFPAFFSAAILFRPMQPFKKIDPSWTTEGEVPVFMSTGAADPTIDRDATHAYQALLEKAGFKVEANELPAGHQLTQQDIQLAAAWFARQRAN